MIVYGTKIKSDIDFPLDLSHEMKAHAWSQCGDNIITSGGGHEEFTVLSVFGWGEV